jgi:hypothetical protein
VAWDGNIEPASLDQLKEGKNGKMHLITADAGSIALRLRELDPDLRLRYSEAGDYYVVYLQMPDKPEDGKHGHLVGTFQECDGRIVKSVEETIWKHRQPGYSLGDDLNAMEDERIKRDDYAFGQEIGDMGEKLAHAFRGDSRIFVKGKEDGTDSD